MQGGTHDGISSVVSMTSTIMRCPPELALEGEGEAEVESDGGGDETGALALLASMLSASLMADALGLGPVDVSMAEPAEISPSNTTGVGNVDVGPEAVEEPV